MHKASDRNWGKIIHKRLSEIQSFEMQPIKLELLPSGTRKYFALYFIGFYFVASQDPLEKILKRR